LPGSSFKKDERLLKRAEFIYLTKSGKRICNQYFIANYKEKLEKSQTRLGITVTKKVGGAVIRNRIKRLVREYFRNNKEKIKRSLDINIIAKKSASSLDTKEAHEFIQLLISNIFVKNDKKSAC
jgi:ribonuclease P protein component